jgi:hypothetical protein
MEKVILIILEMPTVLCPPYQYLKKKIAIIIFGNLSSESANEGIDLVLEMLAEKYCT